MNETDLREILADIIQKYVSDDDEREYLLDLASRKEIPAKGILVRLTPYTMGNLNEKEKSLIADVTFYFC